MRENRCASGVRGELARWLAYRSAAGRPCKLAAEKPFLLERGRSLLLAAL